MSRSVQTTIIANPNDPLCVRVGFTGPRGLKGETTSVFLKFDRLDATLVRMVVHTKMPTATGHKVRTAILAALKAYYAGQVAA